MRRQKATQRPVAQNVTTNRRVSLCEAGISTASRSAVPPIPAAPLGALMPPTPDRTHVIVTACLTAVVAGLAVVIAPGLLPVLALGPV